MTKQVIYSRWEFPLKSDETLSTLIRKYNFKSEQDENGISIAGLNIGTRESAPRAAIIITYDEHADVFLKLALCGQKNISYQRYIKSEE